MAACEACIGVGLAGTNLGFALSSELLPRCTRGVALMLFELFFVGSSVRDRAGVGRARGDRVALDRLHDVAASSDKFLRGP